MKLYISDTSHTLYFNGKNWTLEEYIEHAKQQYDKKQEVCCTFGSIGFEEEELIWSIQNWYGSIGEFSEEELEYLEETWNLTQYDLEFLLTEPEEEE